MEFDKKKKLPCSWKSDQMAAHQNMQPREWWGSRGGGGCVFNEC